MGCGGRKLNGKRQSIDPGARLADELGVGRSEPESVVGLACPAYEQRVGSVSGQRAHGVDMFTGQVQHDPACHQDLHMARPSEEVDEHRRTGDELFDVVEDEQQLL